MSEEEIINRTIAANPSEIIFAITMKSILTVIVRRMGVHLVLTPDDLQLACEEGRAVLEHNLDEKEYISEAYGRAARRIGEVVE